MPHLLERGGGSILNITSVAGSFGDRGFAAYGTAKGAFIKLTRHMAQDLAPKIRVNSVSPGSIATSALDMVLQMPEIEQAMIDGTPLGRPAPSTTSPPPHLPLVRGRLLRHRPRHPRRRRHRGLEPRDGHPRPLIGPVRGDVPAGHGAGCVVHDGASPHRRGTDRRGDDHDRRAGLPGGARIPLGGRRRGFVTTPPVRPASAASFEPHVLTTICVEILLLAATAPQWDEEKVDKLPDGRHGAQHLESIGEKVGRDPGSPTWWRRPVTS